jgi:hypothetical protein
MFTRENVKLLAVATACLVAGSVVPAAAVIVANADKVDGFHAVGSGATIDARKGKLVATSSSTGRLPNNIIKKAPDAAKLGGVNAADLRYLDIPVTAGQYALAFEGLGDVRFPATGGSWAIGFRVPPDHPGTEPITLELDYSVDFTNCAWRVQTVGAVSTVGGDTVARDWFISGAATTASISVPAVAASVFRHTFELNGTVPAGTTVKLALTRLDVPADTCNEVILRSVLVRY